MTDSKTEKTEHELWWPPNNICFDIYQVGWLLEYLPLLREGRWPARPGTLYFDASHKKSVMDKASFVTTAEVAAELDRRVIRCGMDGYLIEDCYSGDLSLKDIAAKRHLDPVDVAARIERVIGYVASGNIPRWIETEKRRGMEYKDWLKNGRR